MSKINILDVENKVPGLSNPVGELKILYNIFLAGLVHHYLRIPQNQELKQVIFFSESE